MVFVGSGMGERPGAPCLKMEQNESKAWTVNSVTNLGKQVFPTHTLLCRVAVEAGKAPKKEKNNLPRKAFGLWNPSPQFNEENKRVGLARGVAVVAGKRRGAR